MVAAMAAKLPFLVLFWFFLPEFLPGNATNLLDPAGRWCFNLDDFDAKFDDISDDNWLKLSKWNAGPTNNAFLPLPLGKASEKNWEKAVRLTAWVDSPAEAVR